MYRHFSKILSGIHNDIIDWVAQTRVKSAQLLYTLLINEEDNVTQHLEKVLNCLQRATSDDEVDVITYVSSQIGQQIFTLHCTNIFDVDR